MAYELQKAIAEFLHVLDAKDKQVLNTQTPTHQDVIAFTAHIDAVGATKKMRSLGRRFQPFLEFVQQFSGVIETFIQANPDVAALVWGGVKTVIMILYNYNDYFEKISEMFLKLGNVCPRLDQLQKLFPSSTGLQQATCAFFATAVNFCSEVVKFLRKSCLKQLGCTIWKPFKAEFKDIESRLTLQRDAIDLEVRIASEKDARQERQEAALYRHRGDAHRLYEILQWEQMKKRSEIQERRLQREVCLVKITSYDHTSVFLRNKEKRIGERPEAISWFVDNAQVKDWKSSNTSQAFWCHGIPGAGKSVLTTSILDHLFETRTQDTMICYFFCSYTEVESLEQQSIIASLAKQILAVQEPWSAKTRQLVDEMCSGLVAKPSLVQLTTLLKVLINEQRKIFILLDGLDECQVPVQSSIISFFKNILGTQHQQEIKIYFATRTNLDVSKIIPGCVDFKLDRIKKRADIAGFIDRKLAEAVEMQQIVKLSHSTMEDIKEALEKRSEGMFLWVDFQVQDICRQDNEGDIRELLNSLPRGLDETYQRILEHITKEKIPDIARRIFTWIAGAKRPLTLDELAEAVALQPEFTSHTDCRVSQDYVKMVHNCGNLVIINELDRTAQFAHFTVKKYLTDESSALPDINTPQLKGSFFWKTLGDIDRRLGVICLTYLTFSDFETQLTRRKEDNLAMQKAMLGVTNKDTWVPLLLGPHSTLGSVWRFSSSFFSSWRATQPEQSGLSFNLTGASQEDFSDKLSSKYLLLEYVKENWIWHSKGLAEDLVPYAGVPAFATFKKIASGTGGPSFLQLPWKFLYSEEEPDMCRYALENGNLALLHLFYSSCKSSDIVSLQSRHFSDVGDALQFVCSRGYDSLARYLLEKSFWDKDALDPGPLPSWIWAAYSRKYQLSYEIWSKFKVRVRSAYTHNAFISPKELTKVEDIFYDLLNERGTNSDLQQVLSTMRSLIPLSSCETVMKSAIDRGNVFVVNRLLGLRTLSQNTEFRTSQYDKFLLQAAASRQVEMVEKFLKVGADANRVVDRVFALKTFDKIIPSMKAAGFRPGVLTIRKMLPKSYTRLAHVESYIETLNALFQAFLVAEFEEGKFPEVLGLIFGHLPSRYEVSILNRLTLPADADGFGIMADALSDPRLTDQSAQIAGFLAAAGLPRPDQYRMDKKGKICLNFHLRERLIRNPDSGSLSRLTTILAQEAQLWRGTLLEAGFNLETDLESKYEILLRWFIESGIDKRDRCIRNLLCHAFTLNCYAAVIDDTRIIELLIYHVDQDLRRVIFQEALRRRRREFGTIFNFDCARKWAPQLPSFSRNQDRVVMEKISVLISSFHYYGEAASDDELEEITPRDNSSTLTFKVIELLVKDIRSKSELPNVLSDHPLLLACSMDNFEVAELLLKAGANPNETDSVIGGTPLIWAIKHDRRDFAQRLIKRGVDVNVPAWRGRTALHYCAHTGWSYGVWLLIHHGADPFALDLDGQTAFRIATNRTETLDPTKSDDAEWEDARNIEKELAEAMCRLRPQEAEIMHITT